MLCNYTLLPEVILNQGIKFGEYEICAKKTFKFNGKHFFQVRAPLENLAWGLSLARGGPVSSVTHLHMHNLI